MCTPYLLARIYELLVIKIAITSSSNKIMYMYNKIQTLLGAENTWEWRTVSFHKVQKQSTSHCMTELAVICTMVIDSPTTWSHPALMEPIMKNQNHEQWGSRTLTLYCISFSTAQCETWINYLPGVAITICGFLDNSCPCCTISIPPVITHCFKFIALPITANWSEICKEEQHCHKIMSGAYTTYL